VGVDRERRIRGDHYLGIGLAIPGAFATQRKCQGQNTEPIVC
jgi:hypothetical protein